MANQTGFQTNTTIHAAFWIYKPDPAIDPTGQEILVEVNGIQKIESTQDHSKVWLYYAANNVSTSQEPYILTGAVAAAFMSDMEALFT
jgi:hypothetical protein